MPTPEQLVEHAKQHIQEISPAIAREQLSTYQILDVREADEYAMGHLPHAIHLPRGVLEFKIADTINDPNTAILVYCKTGGRAALAAQTLGELGYRQVVSLAGGFEAWQADA